jgi:hypothetical protein
VVVASAGAAVRKVAAGFGVCFLPREVAVLARIETGYMHFVARRLGPSAEIICHRKSAELTGHFWVAF